MLCPGAHSTKFAALRSSKLMCKQSLPGGLPSHRASHPFSPNESWRISTIVLRPARELHHRSDSTICTHQQPKMEFRTHYAAIPAERQDLVTTTPSGLPFRQPPCENPLHTETTRGLRIRGGHVSCCPPKDASIYPPMHSLPWFVTARIKNRAIQQLVRTPLPQTG